MSVYSFICHQPVFHLRLFALLRYLCFSSNWIFFQKIIFSHNVLNHKAPSFFQVFDICFSILLLKKTTLFFASISIVRPVPASSNHLPSYSPILLLTLLSLQIKLYNHHQLNERLFQKMASLLLIFLPFRLVLVLIGNCCLLKLLLY